MPCGPVWHLPLYFIDGSFQHDNGIGSLAFWSISLALLPLSVLFTWVYNNMQRAIASALLLHLVGNAAGEALDVNARALAIAALTTAAIAVVVATRLAPSAVREMP